MVRNSPPSLVFLGNRQEAENMGCEELFDQFGSGYYQIEWTLMDGPPAPVDAHHFVTDAPFVAPKTRGSSTPKAPESKVLKAGMDYLRAQPYAHVRKVHGNVYTVGEPDVDAVIGGYAVKLECKAPGKKPTPTQMAVMRLWASAGALVGWFTNVEHIQQLLHHLGERGFSTDVRYPGCSCPLHKENTTHGSRGKPR